MGAGLNTVAILPLSSVFRPLLLFPPVIGALVGAVIWVIAYRRVVTDVVLP